MIKKVLVRTGLFLAMVLLFSNMVGASADFTLPGIDGKAYRLSDYRGKWVVVNYWATWCPPCRAEIPDLVEFQRRNRDKGAVVLGVAYEKIGNDELRKFANKFSINYPILRVDPGSSEVLGPIRGLPTTFLVSPQGEVVAQQAGLITGEAIERFIRNYEKR